MSTIKTETYRNLTWVDGQAPAINAENLNEIEKALRYLMGVGQSSGIITNIANKLEDAISDEATTRAQDDDALEARATKLEKSVDGYKTTVNNEETYIPGVVKNLEAEISNREAAVSQEATTREQADTVEKTAREDADRDLNARKINYTDLLILKCGSSAPDPAN